MQMSMLAGSEKYPLAQWIRHLAGMTLGNVRTLLRCKALCYGTLVLATVLVLTGYFLSGVIGSYEGVNTMYRFTLNRLMINSLVVVAPSILLWIILLRTTIIPDKLRQCTEILPQEEEDTSPPIQIAESHDGFSREETIAPLLPTQTHDEPEQRGLENAEPIAIWSQKQQETSSTSQTTNPDGLTRTQIKVLAHVAPGKKIREVAKDAGMNPRTVAVHIHNISLKTGIKSLEKLAEYAEENGFATP